MANGLKATPPRRRSSAGYPRGEETRLRVITVAIRIFSQFGFSGASTREIAAQAGVTTPVLQYHFESKSGLYAACVDLITASIWTRLQPLLSEAEQLLLDQVQISELIDCYCRLQDALIDCFLAPNEGWPVERLLMWESTVFETSVALQLMQQRIEEPLFAIIAAIVGRTLGKPASDVDIGLHTFALAGMFLVFHLDRARVYRMTGWKPDDGDNAVHLKRILRLHATVTLENLSKLNGTWREDPGEGRAVKDR